ncbi:MAG: hypothetical protein ACJASD_003600, partial [Sphingomonas echinoides]
MMPALAMAATSKGCADINTGKYNQTFSVPPYDGTATRQDYQTDAYTLPTGLESDYYFNNGDVVNFTLSSRTGSGYFSVFEGDNSYTYVRNSRNNTGNLVSFTVNSNNKYLYYYYVFSNTTFDASGNPNSDQSAAHSNSSVFLTLSCTPAGGGSAPTVTAVSPTSGPAGGATSVAITGTGFSSVTAVKFGSVNAASFTVNSATSITAAAPAATAAGAVDVTVTAGGNTSATSSADQFTYNAPTVTGVSPANVPLSGGAITITGTNFVIGNTSFSVGGTSVGGSCTSSTTCTATAGAKAAGAASVVATTGSVSSTTNGTLTYLAVPTISAAFSPTSVSSGGNATLTLTVTNPNTGTALSGIAVGSATLPTNLTGSGAATTCGGTATLSGNALSLSGGALSASASCTVTLTVSSTNAATYNYTSGTVSASGPITLTGSTATTPTGLTVAAAPTLGLAISNGTLTQGQTGTLTVTPSATVANTSGTLTFAITLPANTSLSSSSGTGWSCSGTSTVSCTSASVITAGSNGNPLTLNVAIGASASVSLSFSGTLSGGGAAASANATDSATVVQTPASMAITSGNSQSAGVSTAFASALQVRVLDAASVVIPSSPVTFTAPGSGASGTFSGSGTNSISANTNASGIATSGTFTANATAGGPYTVSATAGSVSQNFSLTNTAAAPTVAAKSASVAYNTATPIDLSASVSGVHSSLSVSTAPAHGTTSIAGDVITYTPTTGYYGSDSFAYTAAGPGGTSGAATVTLTVATPAAPTVAAKSASIAYDTATPIDLTASVSGVHGSLTVSTAPAHGTTSIAGDVITYTPTTGYYGSDSFAYTATGPGGTSGAATVTLTVATPAAPTVAAKSASIAYNTATPIDLTASVSGVHSSLTVSTAPAHGTTSIAGDVITYTPTTGYYGSDSFGYTATGPGGTSAAATVTLTVATPAAPTVAAKSASIAYDTATPIDLTASVSGVHSSLTVSTAPAHGTTSIAGDVITYTPTTGYYGSDSFAYTATGPGGTSGAATVTLTVATPAAPTVAAKSASIAYNTATPIDLTASVSGVHSSLTVSTAPAHGTTSIAGDVITYTPTTGYYGSDSFGYTATGPGGTSAAATVTLTVATPAAPTVAAKSASIAYDTATPIDLTASVSGVHSSLTVSTAPAHGTTSIAGDVITYTPTTGYYGSDSFGYTATGPGGTSTAATVTLTVATPAAPTVAAKSASVAYNTATPIDLTASVSGVHGSLTVSTAPAHGTTSIAGDVITYTPTTGYYGSDSFGYTATGPGGTSGAATVTLTVATPAAPTVAAKSASIAYNTATPIDLTASVSGVHSSLTVSTAPAHGTTSIAGDVITYTPTTGYYGSDSFGYTATGPGGTSSAATVTLTVATPAAPTVAAKSASIAYDTATPIDLTASVSGVHGSLTVSTAPAHGTTSIAGDVIT